MIERLKSIEARYLEIDQELMNPEVTTNIKKTLELNKEQASLREAYNVYQEYKKLISDIEESKELVKDPEIGEFAREELKASEERLAELEKEIY